jgi:hypothetical protein
MQRGLIAQAAIAAISFFVSAVMPKLRKEGNQKM